LTGEFALITQRSRVHVLPPQAILVLLFNPLFLFNLIPVGSRTGAVVLRSFLVCIQGFPFRARLGVSVTPFPAPATSHVACGFAALRAPAHFTSRVMRPIDWTRLSERAVNKTPDTDERVPASHTAIPYSTASSQSPGVVALSLSGAGSSFLPSVRETPARVPKSKVLHPAAQYRIDLFDHPGCWLGAMTSEDLFERL
jgi:hypothetical protein